MVDVGCGPGQMVLAALSKGINALGIDGDFTLPEQPYIHIHDFTTGPACVEGGADLGWSVEFLEHVEEKYIPNFMAVFEGCKYIVCTAAPPGTPGHHHVNCQTLAYWIRVFDKYGFTFDPNITNMIKEVSTMAKPFIKKNGMFFIRR